MSIVLTAADPAPAAIGSLAVVLHPTRPAAPNSPMTDSATVVIATRGRPFIRFTIVYLSWLKAGCLP
jgi:hypothetical protein